MMIKSRYYILAIMIIAVCLPAQADDCSKAKQYLSDALQIGTNQSGLMKKEQLYKGATELCPDLAQAFNNLADVYEKQGRFEEAIRYYGKAAALVPNVLTPCFGLGDVYLKTGRYKEAISWYEKGLKCKAITKKDDEEFALSRQQLTLARDMVQGNVVKAETIRSAFSVNRGQAEIVPLTFAEKLIPFDYDNYDIKPAAKAQLDEIGKALRDLLLSTKDVNMIEGKRAWSIFEIGGHTDCRGADEYNLGLSEKRAKSVANYLTKKFHISSDRLKPTGYGERVPLCTTEQCARNSEESGCHSINRRVEIVRRTDEITTNTEGTRQIMSVDAPSFRGGDEPKLVVDVGFFYRRNGNQAQVISLNEDSHLQSLRDKYFIYVKPRQTCYIYIIQEDSRENVKLLFPDKGKDARIIAEKDLWIPGFGSAFTLDDVRGEETLYLVVTTHPIKDNIEGRSLQKAVRGAVDSLKTRAIKVERPATAPESVFVQGHLTQEKVLKPLISKIEGEGGWVKIVRFGHE